MLHSLASVSYGGVERRHLQVVLRSDARDFIHAFVCPDASGPIAADLSQADVPIYVLGSSTVQGIPLRTVRIARVARLWGADIIHGAVIEGYVPGVLAGRLLRIPTIAEETSDPQNRRRGGHLLARLAAANADYCVGVSDAVVRYWFDQSVPEAKVRLLRNGVPAPYLPAEPELRTLRASLAIPPTAVVVGTIGRFFDSHKRFSDLIRARALSQTPWFLVLVGDGPDVGHVQNLANLMGVNRHVRFVGSQDNVGPYLGIMDIFALASAREAFGLVIVEAMLSGLPVVATDVGGIPSVVRDGVTGVLVPPKSPERLAAEIDLLSLDPVRRIQMGLAGRERATENFSVDRYVSEVEGLYRDLAASI